MGHLSSAVWAQDTLYLSNPAFLFHGHSFHSLRPSQIWILPLFLVTSLRWHNEPKPWLLWFYFISSWVTSSGVYGHLCLFSFEGSLQFLPNLQFSCLAFLSFDNASQFVPRILILHNFSCTEMFNRVKLWLYCLRVCGLR